MHTYEAQAAKGLAFIVDYTKVWQEDVLLKWGIMCAKVWPLNPNQK